MKEIYCSIPWVSTHRDAVTYKEWHRATYWVDSKGKNTVDRYTDGERAEIKPEEVPTPKEQVDAWQAYENFCYTRGTDPLNEYDVRDFVFEKHHWQAHYYKGAGGLILWGARRCGRGEWVKPEKLPEVVLKYLLVKKTGPNDLWYFTGTPEGKDPLVYLERQTREIPGRKYIEGLSITVHFDVEEPRYLSNAAYKRAIRHKIREIQIRKREQSAKKLKGWPAFSRNVQKGQTQGMFFMSTPLSQESMIEKEWNK
jgi:hypothetical protein